jgi:hypothetical protein
MQACTFRQDAVVEAIGREFGTVFVELGVGRTVNVNLEAARAGWAKVCLRTSCVTQMAKFTAKLQHKVNARRMHPASGAHGTA